MLREKLELGKTYPFQITFFEPKEQKMTLSFMDESKKTEKKETEEKTEKKEDNKEEETKDKEK